MQNYKDLMRLLKNKDVIVMIAPKTVGLYLAKQLNVKVKILLEMDQKSPIGIAVKKGNSELLDSIENILQKLTKENKIKHLYQKWFR